MQKKTKCTLQHSKKLTLLKENTPNPLENVPPVTLLFPLTKSIQKERFALRPIDDNPSLSASPETLQKDLPTEKKLKQRSYSVGNSKEKQCRPISLRRGTLQRPSNPLALSRAVSSMKPFPLAIKDEEASQQQFSDGEYQTLVNELLGELRCRMVIQQPSMTNYSIKRTHLAALLRYLAAAVGRHHAAPVHRQHPELRYLRQVVERMKEKATEDRREERSSRMRVESVMGVTYLPEDYRKELHLHGRELQANLKKKQSLQAECRELEIHHAHLAQQHQLMQQQAHQSASQLSALHDQLATAELHLRSLEQSHAELLSTQATLQRGQQRVFNFVSNQSTQQMIKLIREEYKQIESDIYEYAVYLQSNQLASTIDYEPRPFAQLEAQLMEELRTVNRRILQDEGDAEEKLKAMRDFLLKAIGRFKQKDSELGKLNEFKTKCIRQFVGSMKKWLNNWELKQEYLVNLRSQFAVDSQQMREKLDWKSEVCCKQCGWEAEEWLGVVRDCYSKIEQNYLMGNSFY